MAEHHASGYFHQNEDGSLSILVDEPNMQDVRVAFSRHGIAILSEQTAVYDAGELGDVLEVVLDAPEEDIQFALDSSVKLIRPFPPGWR